MERSHPLWDGKGLEAGLPFQDGAEVKEEAFTSLKAQTKAKKGSAEKHP